MHYLGHNCTKKVPSFTSNSDVMGCPVFNSAMLCVTEGTGAGGCGGRRPLSQQVTILTCALLSRPWAGPPRGCGCLWPFCVIPTDDTWM